MERLTETRPTAAPLDPAVRVVSYRLVGGLAGSGSQSGPGRPAFLLVDLGGGARHLLLFSFSRFPEPTSKRSKKAAFFNTRKWHRIDVHVVVYTKCDIADTSGSLQAVLCIKHSYQWAAYQGEFSSALWLCMTAFLRR